MSGLLGRMGGLVGSAQGKLKRAQRLIAESKRSEAIKPLADAAQAGLAEAQFLLARSYLEGAGVPPSAAEGVRWLERAAQQGYLEAQSTLAAMYIRGVPGLNGAGPDWSDEAASLTASLTAGRPVPAQGARQIAGPDFDRARPWAQKAAQGGSAEGQALLA